MKTFGTLVFMALLIGGAAAQTSPPVVPPPAITTPASADEAIHRYGDRNADCAEWTDSCRTCTRPAAGQQVCSNIGPTCQPTAVTCLRKIEAAK